jgi:hypothetical protein
VLGSALSAVGNRIDSKFLTAFWLPAFVAVFGAFGIFAIIEGPSVVESWIYNLESVEQTIAVLFIILSISMIAFVLRALSRPIAEMFAGIALPRAVAEWSRQGQLRVKRKAMETFGRPSDPSVVAYGEDPTAKWINRVYPLADAETKPTLFGNVLAAAVEHPRLAYTMEGILWWPRLSPLAPGAFQDMLGGAQAPTMGLLNLSVIFTGLALGGGITLAIAGGHWTAAAVVVVGGLALARLCYRAAVSQASELASLLRVGFDLYRHDILRQLDIEIPTDIDAERALWRRLTVEMIGIDQPDQPAPAVPTSPEGAVEGGGKAAAESATSSAVRRPSP